MKFDKYSIVGNDVILVTMVTDVIRIDKDLMIGTIDNDRYLIDSDKNVIELWIKK